MKQSEKILVREAFLDNDTKRTITSKIAGTRGYSALFWKADCFECLSLHKWPA